VGLKVPGHEGRNTTSCLCRHNVQTYYVCFSRISYKYHSPQPYMLPVQSQAATTLSCPPATGQSCGLCQLSNRSGNFITARRWILFSTASDQFQYLPHALRETDLPFNCLDSLFCGSKKLPVLTEAEVGRDETRRDETIEAKSFGHR
jgi:hypothetical protein